MANDGNPSHGTSPAVCGFGTATVFLGFCLFEVPSNIIRERVGARVWIALINAIGGLGGFVGPYHVGWINDATGRLDRRSRPSPRS